MEGCDFGRTPKCEYHYGQRHARSTVENCDNTLAMLSTGSPLDLACRDTDQVCAGVPRNQAMGSAAAITARSSITSMRTQPDIPTIIDDLYAGTLDNVAWDRGMIGMADLVSGSAALLLSFNPITGEVRRDGNHGFDPAEVSEYRDHWMTKDIRLAPDNLHLVGEPQFEAKLLPVRSWQMSELYNDFLVRVDAPSILAFWLHKAPDKVVALSIQGTKRRGQFDERDGERIQPLIPHLRCALEIRDRLQSAHVRADSLARSLESVSFGVVLLDAVGHILEANAVAQGLLQPEHGLGRNADGTLWLREPAGGRLNRWIGAGMPPPSAKEGLLHVPRADACPISVLVTPLPGAATSWLGGDPRWVLLLFDPDRRIHACTELIAKDLGISAGEAKIAALLVGGYDIKTLAHRLNISIHTVRTHVKAIFAKTGIRSQAELIQRIVRGPAAFNQTSRPH
jgi:DNA-binding CsgD family transcriptional regulator